MSSEFLSNLLTSKRISKKSTYQLKKYIVIYKNVLAESTYRNQFKGQRYNDENNRGWNHNSIEDSEERIDTIREAFSHLKARNIKSLSLTTCIPQTAVHRIVREKLHIKKINRKLVSHKLLESPVEMVETYSIRNLKNYN